MELQGSKDIDAKRKLHHNIARPCGLFRVQLCLHGVAEGLWNGYQPICWKWGSYHNFQSFLPTWKHKSIEVNDTLKPSHCWTNGPYHWKRLKPMVKDPKTIKKQLKAMVSGLKNIKWKWLAQKNDHIRWFPSDHYNLPWCTYVCMLWWAIV